MFRECRHILPSGFKCRAAALRGKFFCYYHTASRRLARITPIASILLPSVEDAAGVQTAIDQVLRSYGSRRIDRHDAGVFFYGLQIAAGLARRTGTDQKPADTVRDLCDDPKEGIIAPEKSTCEPPDDCIECPMRESCKDYLSCKEEIGIENKALSEDCEPAHESESTDTPESASGETAPARCKPASICLPENPAVVEFPGCEEFEPDPATEYYRGSGIEPPTQFVRPLRKR